MRKLTLIPALAIFANLSTVFAAYEPMVPPGFPDKVTCTNTSPYKVVLVIRAPQLPTGLSVIGLKNGTETVLKEAAQMFTESNMRARFISTEGLKEVHIDFSTKVVTVFNLKVDGVKDGTTFTCQY